VNDGDGCDENFFATGRLNSWFWQDNFTESGNVKISRYFEKQ